MKKMINELNSIFGDKYQLKEIKEIVEAENFKYLYDAIEYFKELEDEELEIEY